MSKSKIAAGFSDVSTAVLTGLMCLGRVEIVPIAVLLTPTYWRACGVPAWVPGSRRMDSAADGAGPRDRATLWSHHRTE